MSNARSPREVCSTTMGISGLMTLVSSYVPGVQSFGVSAGCSFSGVQIDSRASCNSGAIGFTSAAIAIERALQADVVANAVGAALRDELLDVLVVLARLAQLVADLVVGHLDAELVGDGFEHELTRDRERRLGTQALLEHLGRLAGQLHVGVGVDAARLQAAREAGQQLARARFDERADGDEVRRPEELVDRGGAEQALRPLPRSGARSLRLGVVLAARPACRTRSRPWRARRRSAAARAPSAP